MPQAKMGDRVKVEYTGLLADGTVFDASQKGDPIAFTIGDEDLIAGFEQAVIGMEPGDVKTEIIPADQAYGPYLDEMVIDVERTMLPEDPAPQVGDELSVEQDDGEVIPVVVIGVDDHHVKLDANHPLAGKDLTFQIKLLEIG